VRRILPLPLSQRHNAAHELGHCFAIATLSNTAHALEIVTRAGDGYRIAVFPNDWQPSTVLDRLLTAAGGVLAGWAFAATTGAGCTSREECSALIERGDPLALLAHALGDVACSAADRAVCLLGGHLLFTPNPRHALLPSCARLGMALAAPEHEPLLLRVATENPFSITPVDLLAMAGVSAPEQPLEAREHLTILPDPHAHLSAAHAVLGGVA
jgi:hypothetical protein